MKYKGRRKEWVLEARDDEKDSWYLRSDSVTGGSSGRWLEWSGI
jgi:hypothetical protein